ncbi:MAG: PilZ domain-containing protein [Thermodesulfovibrionia bacterium]|nr:PilZ domain-containing protein [Thermodesulfovibrionia bacterium]MCK5427184.1 PilZ domain-containing protein [Thermodesulfovibrionia bacterium]
MEKRTCKRIDTSLEAKFFHGNCLYRGTITNLSEKGICINTVACFPYGANIKLLIPVKEDILEIPVHVKRVAKRDGFYDTMGLELLDQSQNYLEFLNGLSSVL